MASYQASDLGPLLNNYRIGLGPPKTIVIPSASRLADLQDITVNGTLLKKQIVVLDPKTNRRTVNFTVSQGVYGIEQDGDLHFDLGGKQLQPHITCELQNATAWLSLFNQSVGGPIGVGGFFRCLFEHPGFASNDDAHVFEIHPVRAVNTGGQLQGFNVDVPEQKSIHTWTQPYSLNLQDGRITVSYDPSKDTLHFSGMDGKDENYVGVAGVVSNVKPNVASSLPASFTFTSAEIGHPVQVYAIQGTTAARQLRQLKGNQVSMIALRNIDLVQALKGRYVINLLAVDMQG
jgi:hypothetical protein